MTQEEEIAIAIEAGRSMDILTYWLGRVGQCNARLVAHRRAGREEIALAYEAEMSRWQARIDNYVTGLKLW